MKFESFHVFLSLIKQGICDGKLDIVSQIACN
jgi:hypothetical protein